MAMDPELKAELDKVDNKIRFLANIRLFVLFIALLDVLVIFYGKKFAEGAAWLTVFNAFSMEVLFFAMIFILLTIIVRMVLVGKHNKIVKESRNL